MSSSRVFGGIRLRALVLLVVAAALVAFPRRPQYPWVAGQHSLSRPSSTTQLASETAQTGPHRARHARRGAVGASSALMKGDASIPLRGGRLVAIDLVSSSVCGRSTSRRVCAGRWATGLVFVAGDELLTALTDQGAVRWTVPLAAGSPRRSSGIPDG